MKLVYLNNDPSSSAMMNYVRAGDFFVNQSGGMIKLYAVRSTLDGQIYHQLLDECAYARNDLRLPDILFNYNQVCKRDGSINSLNALARLLSSPAVLLFLQNLIDILSYHKDAVDLSLVERLYSDDPQKESSLSFQTSEERYIFPKYLSEKAYEIFRKHISQGETNLRHIYEDIRKKYPMEYKNAIDLFRRDYPHANIYLQQQMSSYTPISEVRFDFIHETLEEHGFTSCDGDKSKWKGPDGSTYAITITKLAKIEVTAKKRDPITPAKKYILTEHNRESIIGAQVYNIRNLKWGLGRVLEEIDVDGTSYISVKHEMIEEEKLYSYPNAIKNNLISIVPEYENPFPNINSEPFIELMRQKYKRYRKPWEKHEDAALAKYMSQKTHPRIIAEKLGRTEPSIIKRAIEIKIV